MRSPASVMSLSAATDWWSSDGLEYRTRGPIWDLIAELGVTLLVTREYEHFVHAISADGDGPLLSVLRVPHPSGIVVDRARDLVHFACTRNPNLVMTARVGDGFLTRSDRLLTERSDSYLVPSQVRVLPGCLYLHDLAIVDSRLVGNAVGLNAVVDLGEGDVEAVWWPRVIDSPDGPRHDRNLLQLNSIASGPTLDESYFTASVASPSDRFPGDPLWKVDRRGVIFSGNSREPIASGLTRPHSVRIAGAGLLVDDSGYGRLCSVSFGGAVEEVAKLPGWTRGLCVIGDTAVVGTSRVIDGYEAYAPGLDPAHAVCGIHLVDLQSGEVRASIEWPSGDQIFGIDWISASVVRCFLGGDPSADTSAIESAWYRYDPGFGLPDREPPDEGDIGEF